MTGPVTPEVVRRTTRVVLVPGTLALLPAYASLEDPVADLRAACLAAVAGLGPEVTVLGDEQGVRVGSSLLDAVGGRRRVASGGDVLVVANGSARRGEKAPGHLDERAHAFDDALAASLRSGEVTADHAVDHDLAHELLASTTGLALLADLVRRDGLRLGPATVGHDDDPHGVRCWVMSWTAGPATT